MAIRSLHDSWSPAWAFSQLLNVQGGGEGGSGQIDPSIGFSDLKFEAFKQSKWNFQYL